MSANSPTKATSLSKTKSPAAGAFSFERTAWSRHQGYLTYQYLMIYYQKFQHTEKGNPMKKWIRERDIRVARSRNEQAHRYRKARNAAKGSSRAALAAAMAVVDASETPQPVTESMLRQMGKGIGKIFSASQ
jgi:hypothetical protein